MRLLNKHFPDPLCFVDAGLRGSSRLLMLLNDFRYSSSYGTITVPKGFITDGASIPQVFWSVLSPFDNYFGAAVIHDYLYTYNIGFNREQADLIFKEAMFNLGVPWYTREVIFRAVRIFGTTSYE